ncbi:MAG: ABATE domain-containing protein [Chloroflexota bacterium]
MNLEAYRFPILLAGNLSLDFSNTVEFRDSERCLEFLHAYDHLVAWCWQRQLISTAESEQLLALASQQPDKATAAHRQALDLRDLIYRLFTAVIAEEQVGSSDLASLNEALSKSQQVIERTSTGLGWSWAKSDEPAQVLAPITLAAAELLASKQLQWIRQCPNCGWLFVDTSRNHSRRWCSMDFCGSKIKSRRQYERRKDVQARHELANRF